MSAFVQYVLWQIPGWLLAGVVLWLGVSLGIPLWLAVVLLSGWIAKDLILFPAMKAVFRPSAGPRPIGARAQAVERLAPSGYVRVNGELWRARTQGDVVEPGSSVIVRSASGLTLIVERADAREA